MIEESSHHAESLAARAVLADATVVSGRVSMAPHDMIDHRPSFAGNKLLLALGAEKMEMVTNCYCQQIKNQYMKHFNLNT